MNRSRDPDKGPVTGYFTGLAGIYAQCRPTYPREAIEAILEGLPRPVTVADVGCGTGISSRLLAAAGANVIGIDPNQDMLEQARRETVIGGAIDYRIGTGERTGLNGASVDIVVCAQSFHWFDATTALKEFHRITRSPHGRVALVWNVRDDRDAFTAGYGEIVRRAQEDAESRGRSVGREHAGDPTLGSWFVDARLTVFPNTQQLDLDGLLGRIRSASYFPKPDNPLRAELESDLRILFDRFQHEGSA